MPFIKSQNAIPANDKFARLIRKWRQAKDLSLTEAGKKLGVSSMTVLWWERGRAPHYLGLITAEVKLQLEG